VQSFSLHGIKNLQAIDKRKTALWTTIYSTFGENTKVKFNGPLTNK